MPVIVNSAEVTKEVDGDRLTTREKHGRVRVARFTYTAPAAHANGSSVNLVTLPNNRVTVLGSMSHIRVSALGGSRVGAVGFRAFTKLDGTAQDAVVNAFATAVDMESATTTMLTDNIAAAGMVLDLDSEQGVTLMLTVTGGTIPSEATIKGVIAYVVD